jgi:hypothetical protein
MARGITENDVWTASDALLLEGARPTIERVRQKIGRGSPNTVSPVERAESSERRTALLIDAERVARAKAEKRAEALERKIESAATEARDALALSVRNAAEQRAECGRLASQLAAAASSEARLTDEVVRLTGLLGTEQRAVEHARGEASVARSLLLQFDVRRRTTKSSRKSV